MAHDHPAHLSPVTFVTRDPDAVLDAVALVRAHASGDGQAASAILAHCCGRCVSSLLAYLVAASADHPEILRDLDAWRDLALPGDSGWERDVPPA